MAFNILVVDDSPIVRSVITKTLKIAGIDVGLLCEASNGQEALDVLNREWIDLVFADINMPVMNGLEMVGRMSQDGLLGTIPVVIISTHSSRPLIQGLKEMGVSAYLKKPFTPETLRKTVEDLLGVRHEE